MLRFRFVPCALPVPTLTLVRKATCGQGGCTGGPYAGVGPAVTLERPAGHGAAGCEAGDGRVQGYQRGPGVPVPALGCNRKRRRRQPRTESL